jgi:hypothetical protein
MSPRNAGKLSLAGLALSLVVSLVVSLGSAQAAEDPDYRRVRIEARYSAGAVERSLVGARRRLERPACERLFSEFMDSKGRPLRDALERKSTSGPEHLRTLLFSDGSDQRPCERSATLAYTSPGSPVVFVCAARFTSTAERNPFLAEAALIHEALHTLGLGENPPTSAAITARVMSRCGG